jgi:O-antigen ligase
MTRYAAPETVMPPPGPVIAPGFARAESPRRLWALAGGGMLCALALPALKLPVGVDLRLGQLAVAGLFALIILRDLHHQQVAWGPLLAIAGGGLLLSGLSLLSVEPSVKEKVFVLKYVVVFPTAFYCGVRLPALAGVRRLTTAVEGTLAFGCLLSLALWLHPVPLLIHERPAYLSVGLKGSFWEQGELAFFAGLFLLASAGRRIEHGLRPRGRLGVIALALLYLLALGCALGSYNKTIWVALVAACLGSAVLYSGTSKSGDLARSWAWRLAGLALVGAVLLALYNAWLPGGEKLVTARMLEHKWDAERGAALRVAWGLITQAPWLGHGFGFVEAYFGNFPSDIIGLGSGVAQLFNSYLDLWLSAGIPGLVYALGLLAACCSRRSLFALLVVGYLFTFANVNPVAQHEYYFLFLGMAFAAAHPVAAVNREEAP